MEEFKRIDIHFLFQLNEAFILNRKRVFQMKILQLALTKLSQWYRYRPQ